MGLVVGAVGFCFSSSVAKADTTLFFDSCQIATLVNEGVITDTISSSGYLFTYTRDKFFVGGPGFPPGRPERIPWPEGVEAQFVTAPPPGGVPQKARIDLQRLDGGVFDLTAFTFELLADTFGAGAHVEIMPLVNGEDAFPDPLFFVATGAVGQQFSYNTSPHPWGSTVLLTGFAEYKITLRVDFAMVALTLDNAGPGLTSCCLPDDSCIEVTTSACASQGGSPHAAGTNCGCSPCSVAAPVPTVSAWGAVVMALGLLAIGTIVFEHRYGHAPEWHS